MIDEHVVFHLREIFSHWTRPRITSETRAELSRQKLIEFSEDGLDTRLTKDGAQRKIAGRPRATESSVNLESARTQKARTPRRFTTPAKRIS
jgi:hypothetical protein